MRTNAVANLLHNDTVVRALARAIADGSASPKYIPGLVRRVIKENMWQERIVPDIGELVIFNQFEDFVEINEPLKGLGTTMDVIRSLCEGHQEVLTMIDQITTKTTPLSPAQQGNDRKYAVARSEHDGVPVLAQRVINREITAAEARRLTGWEKERMTIRLADPEAMAQTLLKTMNKEAIAALLVILADAITNE